jgi:signal transduction histidine kinase
MIEGFEAGANDYLSKPFDGNELLARVKTLIKLKKLTKANLILQEAIEIKNQFINMTIHDLRNPLSVIQGLTTMMRQEIKEDSENAQLMDLVLESSSLMLRLVNELLEAVKIESGKLFLKKEVLNLNVICNEVVDKNRYRASQKGQNLVFSASDIDRCFINADNIRIHEAIDNLLNNAIKYSPLNSNIWINITPKKYDNKDYVRIEIKDEGPGLSEDDKQKIFGKFQRLSAQPTGGESSTGLGLSIVKELVELHDGRIWAESKMGDGSIFIIELPVSDYKVR